MRELESGGSSDQRAHYCDVDISTYEGRIGIHHIDCGEYIDDPELNTSPAFYNLHLDNQTSTNGR